MAQSVKVTFSGSFGLDLNSGSTWAAYPFPDFGTVTPSGSISSASLAAGATLVFTDNNITTASLVVENGPCSGSGFTFSWIPLPGMTPPPTPAPVTPSPTPAPVTPAPVTPAPVTPSPTPAPTPAPVGGAPTPPPTTPPPVTPSPTPAPTTPAPVTPPPVTPPPVTPPPVTPPPVTPAPVTPAPVAPCYQIGIFQDTAAPYGCCGEPQYTEKNGYFNASTLASATRYYTGIGCLTLVSGTKFVVDSADTSVFYTFVNGVRVGGASQCTAVITSECQ